MPDSNSSKFQNSIHHLKSALESGIATLTTKAPETAKAMKAMIDEYGGLGNFVQEMSKNLKQSDFAEKAKVWLEDGKKFVLSQEQVQKLMGDERIQKVADQLKTTPDRVALLIGEALPPILEKAGQAKAFLESASKSIPEDSFVGGILKKFSGLLGKSEATETPDTEAASRSASESETPIDPKTGEPIQDSADSTQS